jgi:hypothetical protein
MGEAKSEVVSHTPGPWRLGRPGTIVADTPIPEMRGSSDVDYYQGHVVCESVVQRNASLIAAAPELLEALELLWTEVVESGNGTANDFGWKKAREKTLAALDKAIS